jgi:hypothetical protein
LLLLIWRQNASYRQADSCGPSRNPSEFPFVATCCTGEFRPRSRCCCTPTSLCLRSHWKQGSLTNQPSTGVFARSLELRLDTGEEPMHQCRKAFKCRADGQSAKTPGDVLLRLFRTRKRIPIFTQRHLLIEQDRIFKMRHFRSRQSSSQSKTIDSLS